MRSSSCAWPCFKSLWLFNFKIILLWRIWIHEIVVISAVGTGTDHYNYFLLCEHEVRMDSVVGRLNLKVIKNHLLKMVALFSRKQPGEMVTVFCCYSQVLKYFMQYGTPILLVWLAIVSLPDELYWLYYTKKLFPVLRQEAICRNHLFIRVTNSWFPCTWNRIDRI